MIFLDTKSMTDFFINEMIIQDKHCKIKNLFNPFACCKCICGMEFAKVKDSFNLPGWCVHQTALMAVPGEPASCTAWEIDFQIIAWKIKGSPVLMHACR